MMSQTHYSYGDGAGPSAKAEETSPGAGLVRLDSPSAHRRWRLGGFGRRAVGALVGIVMTVCCQPIAGHAFPGNINDKAEIGLPINFENISIGNLPPNVESARSFMKFSEFRKREVTAIDVVMKFELLRPDRSNTSAYHRCRHRKIEIWRDWSSNKLQSGGYDNVISRSLAVVDDIWHKFKSRMTPLALPRRASGLHGDIGSQLRSRRDYLQIAYENKSGSNESEKGGRSGTDLVFISMDKSADWSEYRAYRGGAVFVGMLLGSLGIASAVFLWITRKR